MELDIHMSTLNNNIMLSTPIQ